MRKGERKEEVREERERKRREGVSKGGKRERE